MKVCSIIYLVEDGFGQKAFASCEESSDIIQINGFELGLQSGSKKTVYFESEAYHLEEWCRRNDLKYKCVEKIYDFDQLWNE